MNRADNYGLEKVKGLQNVYLLSCVKEEFEDAVNESWRIIPPWERYQDKLMRNLAVLDQEKEMAVRLANFERLSGCDGIYAIRYPNSKKNIRVLYIIEDENVVLITAFLEKKSSDYNRAIKRAKSRIKYLMQ